MKQLNRKPEVNIIPATKRSAEGGGQIRKLRSLRVAAYCRVSTGDESQQTSYTTQKIFYTELIMRKPGWTLAGIYADEAISGTSRAKRIQFNTMMEDAANGKIDYIVTKSISRFARNTVDTLDCVRQLRRLNPPVGIYFEKENIDTLDATGELILTILSALAQDESRSISDNIRWAIQKKFQRGEAMVDLNRMLGYDKGPNGEWLINEEQAKIVRYIFDQYISGTGSSRIACELNQNGIRTLQNCIWRSDSIMRILRNEKYVGDLECQKTVTKNFLTHESAVNTGEAPKYYVKDHHTAIIDRQTWNKVQMLLSAVDAARKRQSKAGMHTNKSKASSPFINLVCAQNLICGNAIHGDNQKDKQLVRMCYNQTVRNYSDERSAKAEGLNPDHYKERYYYSYPVWRLKSSKKADDKSKFSPSGQTNLCLSDSSPVNSVYECALEQSFMEMLYAIKWDYETNSERSYISRKFNEICERLKIQNSNNILSQQRLAALDLQIKETESELNRTIKKQGESTICVGYATEEFKIFGEASTEIKGRLNELKKERSSLEADQDVTAALRKNYDRFLSCIKDLPETSPAGQPLNIYGLDMNDNTVCCINETVSCRNYSKSKSNNISKGYSPIKAAPDLLLFEKGIYLTFIKSGKIYGDTVLYKTSFGITLPSVGNSRTLSDFLGFRRANPDGTVDLLDEKWKVNGRGICYTRKTNN